MIIEFELKDKNGIDVELGSVIQYALPEINTCLRDNSDADFYLPGGTITASVGWRGSRGLVLRVIDSGDTNLRPGQVIPFRRTVHQWSVVERPNTASRPTAPGAPAGDEPGDTQARRLMPWPLTLVLNSSPRI